MKSVEIHMTEEDTASGKTASYTREWDKYDELAEGLRKIHGQYDCGLITAQELIFRTSRRLDDFGLKVVTETNPREECPL